MNTEPAPTSSLLDQLRSRIQVLSEQAAQERDGLNGERDQLLKERDGLSGERDQLVNAFLYVFPYAIYREQRPDLASMSDQQITEHFSRYGIREGVSLEAIVIAGTLKSL